MEVLHIKGKFLPVLAKALGSPNHYTGLANTLNKNVTPTLQIFGAVLSVIGTVLDTVEIGGDVFMWVGDIVFLYNDGQEIINYTIKDLQNTNNMDPQLLAAATEIQSEFDNSALEIFFRELSIALIEGGGLKFINYGVDFLQTVGNVSAVVACTTGAGCVPGGIIICVNIAIDISDTSTAALAKIQGSINEYVNELDLRALDYNLNLITYDGTGVVSSTSYGNDTASFIVDVNALSSTTNTGNDFGSVITELQGLTYRDNSKKYFLNFTNESIGGDGNVLSDAVVDGYLSDLNNLDFKTYIVTDEAYYTQGDIGEKGWQDLFRNNQGGLLDINETDYDDLMEEVNTNIAHNLNQTISAVPETNNIISALRKKLNAMINIIVREVNYYHKKGYTLGDTPVTGVEFFGVIEDDYGYEMGNLRLNTDIYGSLKSLNNVVASRSGAAGDNDIALTIANLRQMHIMKDLSGILSVDDYYQAMILGIGHDGAEAVRIKENQQQLVDSADYHRQSIMGVSMDEEMTNMLKYKYGYNAATKVMNIIDEMMENIVASMGHVGR